MKEKISAVYQIVNEATGDRYVGSSNDAMRRWGEHKCRSHHKAQPNSLMYRDMQKYGIENFRFQILAPVMPECLKQVEQEFIEMLNPTYNNYYANGRDVERQKETHRKYNQSEGQKESRRKYDQSEKGKETHRKYNKKYGNQLCLYNGETLTLHALAMRFRRAGIEHPVLEAKKYLVSLG